MPSTPSPDARVVVVVRLMDRSPVAYAVEGDPMTSGPLVPPCQCPRGGEYGRIGLVHAPRADPDRARRPCPPLDPGRRISGLRRTGGPRTLGPIEVHNRGGRSDSGGRDRDCERRGSHSSHLSHCSSETQTRGPESARHSTLVAGVCSEIATCARRWTTRPMTIDLPASCMATTLLGPTRASVRIRIRVM